MKPFISLRRHLLRLKFFKVSIIFNQLKNKDLYLTCISKPKKSNQILNNENN